jgi:hypothetical protein
VSHITSCRGGKPVDVPLHLPLAHQIRVHLQYLGHPIVNDPLYGDPRVWGPGIGKGGVDLTPDRTEDEEGQDGKPDEGDSSTTQLSSEFARMRGEEALPSGKIQPRTGKTEQDLARLKRRLKGGTPTSGSVERRGGGRGGRWKSDLS